MLHFINNGAIASLLYVIGGLILSFGCCSRHPSPAVLIPALRTVGNIVTGDDLQTQVT